MKIDLKVGERCRWLEDPFHNTTLEKIYKVTDVSLYTGSNIEIQSIQGGTPFWINRTSLIPIKEKSMSEKEYFVTVMFEVYGNYDRDLITISEDSDGQDLITIRDVTGNVSISCPYDQAVKLHEALGKYLYMVKK